MTVIAGTGAKELYHFFLTPRTDTVTKAICISSCNHIVHNLQTGRAAQEGLFRLTAQYICPVLSGNRQTGQLTVVSCINAIREAFGRINQTGKNITYDIQLACTGLSACHIQLQILFLASCKLSADRFIFSL